MNKNIITYVLCCLGIMGGIISYKKVVPTLNRRVAQRIYNILEEYRITYDIDKHSMDAIVDCMPQSAQGVDACMQSLSAYVKIHKPIHMLLVGYPFKSHNSAQKVIAPQLDMAERKSLEYLQKMLTRIQEVYKPGAKIFIFCDGIPFANLFGISEQDVVKYEQDLKQVASDLPDITVIISNDIVQKYGLKNRNEIITLIDSYEPTNEQFKKSMGSIPESALKRIGLEFEYPQGKRLMQQLSLEEISYQLMAREARMRNLIAQTFPSDEYMRLTVHLSVDVSKKFGIKLSPTSDVTPYHGALVQERNGDWNIKFKKDINQLNYVMKSEIINGLPLSYFAAL